MAEAPKATGGPIDPGGIVPEFAFEGEPGPVLFFPSTPGTRISIVESFDPIAVAASIKRHFRSRDI